MSARRPRVFLGLTELSGYYSGLQEGFDELGIRCTRIALEAHPYGYRDTDWPRHVGAIRRVEAALAAPRRYRCGPPAGRCAPRSCCGRSPPTTCSCSGSPGAS
jgi:hypothetical protein